MGKILAKASILLITLVLTLDLTIINTALNNIQTEFCATISQIQWVINAFALSLSAFLIAMSRLADMWGRKKILLVGMTIFILASLLANFSPNIETMIIARFFLGLSIAILHPVTQVLMVMQYPASQRKRAVALWVMALGVGLVLGPFVGGLLVTYSSWRMVFMAPAVLMIFGSIFLHFFVHEKHEKISRKIHPLDTALLLLFLFFLVFGLIEGRDYGWSSKFIIIIFVISALLFCFLIIFERRLPDPMVPLALLKKTLFVVCCLINFAISFFSWSILFLVPYYLQNKLGYSSFHSGLFLLFFAVCVIASSQTLSLIKRPFQSKNMFFLGLILYILATIFQVIFSFNLFLLAISLVLIGLATPVLSTHSSSLAFSLVENKEMTTSAGFIRTCQTIGGMIGVSVNGSVIASLGLVKGFPVVFTILFFCALFMMLLVLFLIPSKKKRLI